MAFASGYFKTTYGGDLVLLETRLQKATFAAACMVLIAFPLFASPFFLGLANQVFLAIIGAAALMLLTGYAGQISLGHAGLLASGALTTGIMFKELGAPFWITLPSSAIVGAVLGIVFGIPSLRLKGLYLAVSTLALHFVVVFIGGEYETRRGFSTGVVISPPQIGGFEFNEGYQWYIALLAIDIVVMLFCINLVRSRTGRALMAIRDREIVAEAVGIPIQRYKLTAFVLSSAITAVAGGLMAYYRGFVAMDAFTLDLTIEYVAMVIIGGLGSMPGVVLGALFVVTFPYVVEGILKIFPIPQDMANEVFAINFAGFGLIMILFLVFEPLGMVGIWHRIRNYFLLWPFRQTGVGGGA